MQNGNVVMERKLDVIWVRAAKGTKSKWVKLANSQGMKLGDWIIQQVNQSLAVNELLAKHETTDNPADDAALVDDIYDVFFTTIEVMK